MVDFLMDREKHEDLLAELLNPDLEQSRKTEILQDLRTSHTNAFVSAEEMVNTNKKLRQDNDDLIVSNSKLFRQTGVTGEEYRQEEEKENFSETVSIEDLEQDF